jgi:hypothetical protein
MKGGFIEEVTNSISSGLTTLSQGVAETYNKAKNAITSETTSTPQPSSYTPLPTAPASYGGKKNDRKKRTKKHMRGGFSDNIATTGLASSAEPISGIKTAQPHNLVGGKSKRRHRNKKSNKSRKSKKTVSRRR